MRQKPVDTREYPTLRVTFEFDSEGTIAVRSKEHVDMVAPPTAIPIPDRAAGTMVDLLDADGQTVFRRAVHDPFHMIGEHFSPDGTIEAVPRPVESGEFEVLLPLVDDARSGVLLPGERPDLVPGQEPVRFDLDEEAPEDEGSQS